MRTIMTDPSILNQINIIRIFLPDLQPFLSAHRDPFPIGHQKIGMLHLLNLIQQIERETDARVGGELYSDALSPAGGDAATYLAMLEHNLNTLLAALEKQ